MAQSPTIVVENGKTAPAFDYTDAIRERVFIPQPGIDQDRNGGRPHGDRHHPPEGVRRGPKMPAIIDPSPYYTTVCRGNEGQ